MTTPASIESMHFEFDGHHRPAAFTPVLVGVVGSGNLEVMVEPASHDRCTVSIETSARDFQPIWAAVVRDFHERHHLAGVTVSVNDMGATPAVVSLRLDQAVAGLKVIA